MASSLSLISSGSDPEKKPSHIPDPQRSDPQKSNDASDTAQSAGIPRKPVSFITAQPISSNAALATTAIPPAPDDVLRALRRSVDEVSQPADNLMRASAEAARLLTGADGVALAFRAKGVIICRARSGELAPDLGSCVNANSGISGECLRTASILVCEDAYADPRVDNDVCQRMGIRSIVVVPLRGPVGIAGILEVFSAHLNAFGSREINSLRGLAEIAEAAYEQERRAQQEATRAALRPAHRLPALLARAVAGEGALHSNSRDLGFSQTETTDPRPERFIWALGVSTVSLLLIAGVWLSWHGPISELAELEAAQAHSPTTQSVMPPKPIATPPKPVPGIVRGQADKLSARIFQTKPSRLKAANGKSFAGQTQSSPEANAAEQIAAAKTDLLSSATSSPATEKAPIVKIHAAQNRSELPALPSDREPLPVMDAPISHGVTQGELIRKVDPVYPVQALAQRITGPVVLEVRVGEDGTVRNVVSASGDPVLVTAAMQAVRQWQYSPTLLDRRPIETTKRVTVVFKLP